MRETKSIRRKLMAMLLLTSGTVLLLTCLSFIVYESITFRRQMVTNIATLARVVANNSTAALAFDNQKDAEDVLDALKAEPNIIAAALYDSDGKWFAAYPGTLSADTLRQASIEGGYRFENALWPGYLVGAEPVLMQDGRRFGTLYIKANTRILYTQLELYTAIAIAMAAAALLLAYLISRVLQRQISEPVLRLAETAEAITSRNDYSVRAKKYTRDELGVLTDSFNQMLARIQQHELTIRESEARVRAVLNSALSAVVVIDSGDRIIDWNARAEEMFGWRRHEALGTLMAELIIPPAHRESHLRGLERYLSTSEGPVLGKLLEMSALRRDGSKFPVELSINVLSSGSAATFCGFITDITARQREEKARAQLAAIVESSEDAIISKTLDGKIVSWNPGAERLFGYSADECLGNQMSMLLPPHRADEETEILRKIARGEAIKPFETERLRKGGTLVDVSVAVSPIRNSSGHIIGISNMSRDIAEYKQAQTKIQAQLARLDLLNRITSAIGERQDLPSIFKVVLQSLEEHLPIDFVCICLYDAASHVLTVSSIGERSRPLAGALDLSENANLPIDQNGLSRCVGGELVYEPDITAIDFPFPRRLAGGGLRSLLAAPLRAESIVFGVLIAASNHRNRFGSNDCEFVQQLSKHVALASHQARLYSALQGAYDELRQSQYTILQQERLRALGQMASGVAHDINNAISPVSLYTESLLHNESGLSERARTYLQTIQRAVDDVAKTVSRMREFYRPREHELTFSRVNMNEKAQQVIELTQVRWRDVPQQSGAVIELKTEFATQLPEIFGASNEIRDALTNLVFNAVDAMPNGGTLTLRTYAMGKDLGEQAVAIEVTDTGVGMDEQTKQRCLEPFYTTKGERGTGLGLAMVYGMAQRHTAELQIDSEPGKGTTVRLIFAAAKVASGTAETALSTRRARRSHILIVDDDPLIIESMREILQRDGHTVLTADGGQKGIDAFAAAIREGKRFDVVITDLGMPYMDGRRVAAAIKELSSATPVILLTGWGQRLATENDVPMYVDRVMNKPPKLSELRSALADFLPSQDAKTSS